MKQSNPSMSKASTISRRTFMKRSLATAGALVAPHFVPASALGRNGALPPSERIVLAGIGHGPRGRYDLSVMLPEKDVRFVAVCDVQRSRCLQAKEMVDSHYGNGDCVMYRDMFEVFDRSDVDAVLIATGDRWHALASILAMKAGKDVYSEKPCGMTIREIQALAEAADRYGRVFQAGTQRRSQENFQYAVYLAQSGMLGQLHTLHASVYVPRRTYDWLAAEPEPQQEECDWDRWLGPSPWRPYNKRYVEGGWRGHYDFEGAANFLDWGAHTLDLCQWANRSDHTMPVECEANESGIIGRYANGVRLICDFLPDPEAPAALREAMGQTEGKLLVGVINSIAALREETAVAALSELIRDSNPEIVRASLLALGRISNDEAMIHVRRALLAGPEAFRPDAAAACLLAAQSQLHERRADTAKELYDAVRQARVPASYRIGATRGAILARKSDRVPFLIRQLRSDERAIREVALLTIREIPSDELATALNAELKSAPRDLQIQLLIALKDCNNAQSLEVIRTKIRSDDPEVRLAALRVLAGIGGPDDASTFLSVIRDRPGAEEVSVAVNSLERMEGAGADELILKALRSSSQSEVRVELIRLLGKRNSAGATNELLEQAVKQQTGHSSSPRRLTTKRSFPMSLTALS